MEKLSEKSKLALFIYNFIHSWVNGLPRELGVFNMNHVRTRMDRTEAVEMHANAFYKYCEPYGFHAKQIDRIYEAAFHWRKGANGSVHIFEFSWKEVCEKVSWFEKQRAAADRAATAASVLKASAAAPIVLELDTTTTDLPLLYWALKYEVDEAFETGLAEIAAGT